MRFLTLLSCVLTSAGLVGCTGDDVDEDYYHWNGWAVTTIDSEDWATGYVYGLTDPLEEAHLADGGPSLAVSQDARWSKPLAAIEVAAEHATPYFMPAECVSVVRDGTDLTYALSGCVVPFASTTIDGTLRVSFSDGNGWIGFRVVAEGLRIDGMSAEFSADALYAASADTRTVRYTSESRHDGDTEPFSAALDSTLAWRAGSRCVRREATGRMTTGERTFDLTVAGFARCAGKCPTSGVVTSTDGMAAATLTFDGTGEATLERRADEVKKVPLDCE